LANYGRPFSLTVGQKTSLSFLIDMNLLFQNFVGNLLREKITELEY